MTAFKEKFLGWCGNIIILIEVIVLGPPLLTWWIPIWIIKWTHPKIKRLSEAEAIVGKYSARVICWPALLLLQKLLPLDVAETIVLYFGTAVIFWGGIALFIYHNI